jgi:mRNA export factor
VVSCFIDSTGFAVGSIEGRVGIQYAEEKDRAQCFSFKCHRDEKSNVYPVNAMSFHPQYGTFSTAGSDGVYFFWDKDSKQKLKTSSNCGQAITASSFNRNGTIFAYALGYDWLKGHEHNVTGGKNCIMLAATKDDEVKPRPKKR